MTVNGQRFNWSECPKLADSVLPRLRQLAVTRQASRVKIFAKFTTEWLLSALSGLSMVNLPSTECLLCVIFVGDHYRPGRDFATVR